MSSPKGNTRRRNTMSCNLHVPIGESAGRQQKGRREAGLFSKDLLFAAISILR
jgi:hypothetical protein